MSYPLDYSGNHPNKITQITINIVPLVHIDGFTKKELDGRLRQAAISESVGIHSSRFVGDSFIVAAKRGYFQIFFRKYPLIILSISGQIQPVLGSKSTISLHLFIETLHRWEQHNQNFIPCHNFLYHVIISFLINL